MPVTKIMRSFLNSRKTFDQEFELHRKSYRLCEPKVSLRVWFHELNLDRNITTINIIRCTFRIGVEKDPMNTFWIIYEDVIYFEMKDL